MDVQGNISFLRKRKIRQGLKAMGDIFNCPPYPSLLLDSADSVDLALDIVADENPLNIFNEKTIRIFVNKLETHLKIVGYINQISAETETIDFSKYSTEWAISCNYVTLAGHTLAFKAGRVLFNNSVNIVVGPYDGLTIYGCICREYGKLMLELKGVKDPSEFEVDMSTVYCGLGSEFSVRDGAFMIYDPKTSKGSSMLYYPHRISMCEYQYARSICRN